MAVETRDYAIGGLKFKVHSLQMLRIGELQFRKINYNCQKPHLYAKVRLVFISKFG